MTTLEVILAISVVAALIFVLLAAGAIYKLHNALLEAEERDDR